METATGGLRLRTLFPGLSRQAAVVGVSLEGGRPVRLGESAVASTMVHLLEPRDPGAVHVLTDRDAGRVLYGRSERGGIIHLDVFHEVGDVDHHRLADALRLALSAYAADFRAGQPGAPVFSATRWADRIDLQTGTGGGRLSGDLAGGRKASLRQAHRNHAHITLMLPRGGYALLFYLVAAAESAIAAQGLDVRRVETIVPRAAACAGEGGDLEPYRDRGDSMLTGTRDTSCWQRRFSQAVALADLLAGTAAAGELLEHLGGNGPVQTGLPGGAGTVAAGTAAVAPDPDEQRAALAWLAGQGLLSGEPGRPRLNADGYHLMDVLRRHCREVDQALKRLARTRAGGPAGRLPPAARRGVAAAGGGGARRLVAWWPGEPPGEPALPETVAAAAARCLAAGRPHATAPQPHATAPQPHATAPQPHPTPAIRLDAADLRHWERRRARALDLCLLIDASASMAGPRIAAAKDLARHLLLQTRDRVAVVTFQERQVDVPVSFTRNYGVIQEGLRRIRPAGLTPLALALREAARMVRGRGGRRILIVLITDGIPTMAANSQDPLGDALVEASRLADTRARLVCVGLQPNSRFLRRLVAAAGGSLHVVEDLRRDVLLAITHAERQAAAGKMRDRRYSGCGRG